MSNDLTAVAKKEIAVDIQALFVGTAASKSPAPAKNSEIKNAVADKGNTNRQPEDFERTKKAVQEAVEFFEKYVKQNQCNLKFSVDAKSNDIVVQLFDKGTGELIRQIPSEDVLKLRQKISDLLGILYDKQM
jgi:flagellar protein FlaG